MKDKCKNETKQSLEDETFSLTVTYKVPEFHKHGHFPRILKTNEANNLWRKRRLSNPAIANLCMRYLLVMMLVEIPAVVPSHYFERTGEKHH